MIEVMSGEQTTTQTETEQPTATGDVSIMKVNIYIRHRFLFKFAQFTLTLLSGILFVQLESLFN